MRNLLTLTAFTALMSTSAPAHEYRAQNGRIITWYAGNGCCNNTDCRPIKSRVDQTDAEREAGTLAFLTEDGIRVTVPKTVTPRASGDMMAHVCAKGIPDKSGGDAHCYFVPGQANMTPWPWKSAALGEFKSVMCRAPQ